MTVRAALLLAFLALGASGRVRELPRVVLQANGMYEVTLAPAVLLKREVRKQLDSGLTTAFVVSMRGSGALRGGVRVEVRYMLWDEHYAVTTLEGDGRSQTLTLASYDKLVAWWDTAPLRLTADQATGQATADRNVRVTLEVLPFSAREEAETKRWLAESLGNSRTRQGDARSTSGPILDVIIGTSIQRRPILEYRWAVPVGRPAEGTR